MRAKTPMGLAAAAGLLSAVLAGCSTSVESTATPVPPPVPSASATTGQSQAAAPRVLPVTMSDLKGLATSLAKATVPDQMPAGSTPVNAADVLTGPGMVVGLGRDMVQVMLGDDGKLADPALTWAGCLECAPVKLSDVLWRFARDLTTPSAQVGVMRHPGYGAAVPDPRGDALSELPTYAVHVQDPAENRWRTWYVITDAEGIGVVGLVAETGPLGPES